MAKCENCADSSSTSYSRCNPPISSDCVMYQGANLECASDETFSICKGQKLSAIQEVLFNKICSLSGQDDITTIEFPCSLQEAWEEQDPTLLNLLSYFTQIACDHQASIATLTDSVENINPAVEVCLECCEDDCGTVKILLSDALNKIISCLCAAKAQITALQTQVDVIQTAYNGLQTQLTALETFQTTQLALNVSLQLRLASIESKTDCLPEC